VAQAENRELLQHILQALDAVSRRDQEIITQLFGLDDTTPIKLEQVASIHNLTCERVRQIKKAAFESVRRSPYAAELAAY
jgi:DNA-directed RNA polymerase sigma subunit (sigma70/sigma32)